MRPASLFRLATTLMILSPILARAQSWTFSRTNVAGVLAINGLAYGNGRFVALTGGSVSVIWSTDGSTWHPVPGVAGFGPSLVFASGAFHAVVGGEIWRSPDGERWQPTSSGLALGTGQAIATDGRSLLFGASNSAATLMFSPDTLTFRPTAPLPDLGGPGMLNVISGVAHGAGRYFVSYFVAPNVPATVRGYVASTVDGSSWARFATGTTTQYYMAGNADRFIAFVDNNRALITTNGTTASIYPLPFPVNNGDNLVQAGGRFFMSRSLVSSLDGLAWAPLAPVLLPTGVDLRSFAYGKGRYLTAGWSNTTPPIDVTAYLNAPAAPLIERQPISASIVEGESATFSVTIENPDITTSFQWRRDGTAIAGATAPIYTLASVRPADAGTYTVAARNAVGPTLSAPAALTVVPAAQAGRIINLSILTALDAANPNVILGFVLGGRGTGGAKPLLVRAAGPSLTRFGVTSPLADPRLELYAGATKSGENDNWGGDPVLAQSIAAVGAFAYLSADAKDAALFASAVTSRDNSVKISAVAGASGPVLAEVYDASPGAVLTSTTPRLVNVSVIQNLSAGAALSAGFVIGGVTSKTVLIRAVGPGLAPFGVSATLDDPRLTLNQVGATTVVAANNDWGSDNAAQLSTAFSNVGAFGLPANSRDAALIATLAPGNYVAQVSGTATASGTVLVEIYEVP